LSDKNSKGISSIRPRSSATAAPLSGASFAAVVSAIHHGNFFHLSDYNLDLLIQTLAGKNSTALETISIKSAVISVADARLLAKLIRSSDAANIKVLKLDRNAISQDAFKQLFDAWKHNRTITALSMSRSGVDDKAIKYIAKALVKAETLRELDLSHNKITVQGIQMLCEALILNRSVTRLCIDSNNIKKAGAPHLAGLLAKNCVIRHLNVGSNGLGAEGCSMIADAVRLNGTLNSLSLDMNEMGSMGASAIAAALASNQRLTHLYIPHNNIGDQGMTEICESLKKNNSLISLDVELNQIGHGQSVVGMKALAEVLRTNKHLREINLSYNVFSSEAIQELMKGAADNSTLESIILTNCCITTQGATTIAEVLPTATGLQNLGLTANFDIAEEGYQALATNLSKNRSMKGIQLDYNSQDRHVLYESIQCSLTRNFIWQQAVYTAACRILTLSRIVLLGRPANQKTSQSQWLQRQQLQGSGAWSLLKKVGLGRNSSSNSLVSMLSLGRNRISVDPSSPAASNYADSGNVYGTETPGVSRKNSRQGAHPSASPPPSPLLQHSHSFDGSHLSVPYQQQHGVDSELLHVSTQARSSPDLVTEDCNAHKVMANLVNMPHEIFESICAFLDDGQNMSIAQIRTTIRMAGDKSTLSESYTKARMLERIFHSRYIPPIGMRYGVKNADERV
jgi:Ran GTPase-activating protein (RanGAP) involved in mRNA processing and transport